MKNTIQCFLVTTACLVTGQTQAGPFGLQMGTQPTTLISELKAKPEGRFLYHTKKVPLPHPDFVDYSLFATKQHGLCRVNAVTELIRTSVYGTELKSKFIDIAKALSAKYGDGKATDELNAGSIWSEPRDWMKALDKNERTLAAVWMSEKEDMPDEVLAIHLVAMATGGTSGIVAISYDLRNASACLKAIRNSRDAGL